ncbi:MAG TPA: hypothetical protein VMH05_08270, partial [Bryobacteraceae bacterium]|nr:hypothetical protein [Bryobacteraceae bacterium]
MPRFALIFDSLLDQESRIPMLDEMAKAAGWTVLQPGESIQLDEGTRSIVISGVTWSRPDLEV